MPINVTERGVMPPDQTGSQLGQGTATAPALITESAGFQLVDSTNPYILRFSIPLSLVLIRRARLSFSLSVGVYPAISGSVAGGNTSAESANHNHGLSGNTALEGGDHTHGIPSLATPNHAHDMLHLGGTGPGNTSVYTAGDGSLMQILSDTTGTKTTYLAGGTGTGSGTSGGRSAAHVHGVNGNTGTESVAHVHSIVSGGVTFGAPTSLGRTPSLASAAHIYLATNGGPAVEIKPISTQVQPPYSAVTYADLDFSSYFVKIPATYELTISSATLGGIMAQMQLTGELNVS